MSQTKKASVLVYSLLVLFIMLTIAISISSISTKNMQSTMTSNKSSQALQTADSGMEIMMKKIKDETDRAIITIGELGTCNDGKIILLSDSVGKGTVEISFFNVDEDTGTSTRITDCDESLSEIDEIKSIGSYGDTVRAVKMKVAEANISSGTYGCTGTAPNGTQTKCSGAESGLTENKSWHKSTDNCSSDTKCAYKEGSSPITCSGVKPTNTTICSGSDSGLTAATSWSNVTSAATCGTAKCKFYCNSGYTYSSGACVASEGGSPTPKPEMQLTGTTLVLDHDLDFNYPAAPKGYCENPGDWDYKTGYFVIWNRGGGHMNVNINTSVNWISLNIDGQQRIEGQRNISYSFSNESLAIEVNVDICRRPVGKYSGNISVTSSNAVSGSPETVSVTSNVYPVDSCQYCGQ